jgi:dTDP-4-amino-4,6-dideoxygalactose transaminase
VRREIRGKWIFSKVVCIGYRDFLYRVKLSYFQELVKMRPSGALPIFSLKKQHEALQGKLSEAFQRVLASGAFILGPELDAWEKEFGEFLGTHHAVGVSSGSDALVLALQALGVGPGDEVVVPSYTFFASAGSVARLGARPVFVDSAPCCYNLNVSAVANAIGPKTRAIMAVHLFGQAADMEALVKVATKANLPIVEDVAQALGAKVGDRYAGTIGTLGCFSFFPTKNLGGLGEGGMVVTSDPQLAEKVRKLRVHGAKTKYYHEFVGGNFRLHELQAAFLRVKLPHLSRWIKNRQQNAAIYRHSLTMDSDVRPATDHCECENVSPTQGDARNKMLLPFSCHESHTYNQFVVRFPGDGRRDRIREKLQQKGVGTEVYYPRPLHVQECFQSLGWKEGAFPWAETFAKETLALPIFPELEPQEIQKVASELLKAAQDL